MTWQDSTRHKLATAPTDLRFAVLFSTRAQHGMLTALIAVYLEIREIARECTDPSVAHLKLLWWQEEVSLLLQGRPRHPLTNVLAHFLPVEPPPIQLFMDIIEGVRTDIAGSPFAHFHEVEHYCHCCGGALLELAALLSGAQRQRTLEAARRLGLAWQLTEIVLRCRLLAKAGWVHLAADDLLAHGVDRQVIGTRHPGTECRALLADYTQRIRTLLRYVRIDAEPERSQLSGGWILCSFAQARLNKFARSDYKTDRKPVELGAISMLVCAWRSARMVAG